MKTLLACLLLGVLCVSGAVSKKKFHDHKLFSLNPDTEEQKNLILDLEESGDLDFWTGVNNAGRPVTVLVGPEDQEDFVKKISKVGLKATVTIEDIQKKIDQEDFQKFARSDSGLDWDDYYPLDVINAWIDKKVLEHPGKASVVIAGYSYEKRPIKGLKISFGGGNKSVVFEGGIHSREWISPATVTYLANQLLESKDKTFRKIAKSFDWYIFPVTNPDGYVYSHIYDRLWRKTRTPHGRCTGADPNRNWDFHWNENNTYSKPCEEEYAGPNAFSELSVYSLSKFLETIGNRIEVYISFHSFGEVLLIPYGHTRRHLDNYKDAISIGRKAVKALAKRYGTQYVVGSISDIMYFATGSSVDWVKMNFKTPLVYAYEMRGGDTNGFVLPTEQIIPNCLEIQDSIVAMFQEAVKKRYFTLH